jgi:hypothetical protein
MSGRNESQNHFDELSSRLLGVLSQRSSRRGVLARLGKVALSMLGVSLLPNLPLDRLFDVEAQSGCSALELCGIYGAICNTGSSDCCNGGVGSSGCPSCTSRGYFAWTKCCLSGECGTPGYYVEYWDCCGGTDADAYNCYGTFCRNNTTQPQWCSGGAYRCTVAVVTYEPCDPGS